MELKKMNVIRVKKTPIGYNVRLSSENGEVRELYLDNNQTDTAVKSAKVIDADLLLGITVVLQITNNSIKWCFTPNEPGDKPEFKFFS